MIFGRQSIVLHVEDDDVFHEILVEGFEEAGVGVSLFRATHGKEALEWLLSGQEPIPDLILLDLGMPVMDGLEFLAHWSQSSWAGKIPVIILTTSNNPTDRSQAEQLGVGPDDFLSKPVSFRELSEILQRIGHVLFPAAPNA